MSDGKNIGKIFKTINSLVIFKLVTILVTAVLLIIVIQRVVPWIANRLPGRKRLYVLSIIPYIRLLIILTAIFLIIPLLIEPSVQNMVTILASVGIALGFAFKDYVSGVIAGIVAIGEFNYRNGDWVQFGDVYGEVRNIGIRTVEIVTPEDSRVLIPHSFLWNSPIINANNGDARLQCIADFYINPIHDAQQVKKMLENVALTSPYLYFGSPVTVIVKEEPWGTHYRLKAYPVNSSQQFSFITDMTVRGKAVLLELGVEFAATTAIPTNRG